jgi:hypothetical protein
MDIMRHLNNNNFDEIGKFYELNVFDANFFSKILRNVVSETDTPLQLIRKCISHGADPFYRTNVSSKAKEKTAFLIAVEKSLYNVLSVFINYWIYSQNPSHLIIEYLAEMIRMEKFNIIQYIYNTIRNNFYSIDNTVISKTYDILRMMNITYKIKSI